MVESLSTTGMPPDTDGDFRSILDQAEDGYLVLDSEGGVLWASTAASRFFGTTPRALIGHSFGVPVRARSATKDVEIVTSQGGSGPGQMTTSRVEWGGRECLLVTIRDTGSLADRADATGEGLMHDPGTGLPARELFDRRLEESRIRAARYQGGYSVIVISVDSAAATHRNFVSFGSADLIGFVATRLRDFVGPTAALFQIDPHTFALIEEDVNTVDAAREAAREIAAGFDADANINGRMTRITLSPGVAQSDSESAGDTVNALDHALAALREGYVPDQTTIGVFTDDAGKRARRQRELSEALPTAIADNQLRVFYQPIVSATTGDIEAAEALVRWRGPGGKLIQPAQFLPVAESLGLMGQIDTWVFREACRQTRIWQMQVNRPIVVHINITAQALTQPGFADGVRQILDETAVDPTRISIELTETAEVRDVVRAVAAVQQVQDFGCTFAIDDFGTGFSSFAYLERFKLDLLKIDRSFVSGMESNVRDRVIVGSMIAMARGLGARCIGEGIETQDQAEELRELKCHQLQGYLFGKPMPADELETQFPMLRS